NTHLDLLKDLGEALLSYPPPWFKIRKMRYREAGAIFFFQTNGLSHDIIFGSFIVVASALESAQKSDSKSLNEEPEPFPSEQKEPPSPFLMVLRARWKPNLLNEVQAELDANHLTAEQQDFIWRWIRQEINLTKGFVLDLEIPDSSG